ncbi:ribosomal RNA-processing protein 8 [Dromiciops gliroides]|uniref:ribosomal RNA-processing protein 8 n=1 Tax=Dromiciops gliroides TaxID=33562 RepID=UPI001CC74F51|nr:ribosomal RNA-processing protein 8 [Dromiciops gliroides]
MMSSRAPPAKLECVSREDRVGQGAEAPREKAPGARSNRSCLLLRSQPPPLALPHPPRSPARSGPAPRYAASLGAHSFLSLVPGGRSGRSGRSHPPLAGPRLLCECSSRLVPGWRRRHTWSRHPMFEEPEWAEEPPAPAARVPQLPCARVGPGPRAKGFSRQRLQATLQVLQAEALPCQLPSQGDNGCNSDSDSGERKRKKRKKVPKQAPLIEENSELPVQRVKTKKEDSKEAC